VPPIHFPNSPTNYVTDTTCCDCNKIGGFFLPIPTYAGLRSSNGTDYSHILGLLIRQPTMLLILLVLPLDKSEQMVYY
jgi:hypothetical protein